MQPASVGGVAKACVAKPTPEGQLALQSAQTSVEHTPEPVQHRIELGWREDSFWGRLLFRQTGNRQRCRPVYTTATAQTL